MIKDDLRIFTTTSDKPYDRHKYKINLKNGKSITVEDYQTVRQMWHQWMNDVDSVDIIDESGKGF